MSRLNGKVAWVTGAGSGIGLAGAKGLAEAGATVVMSGRRKEILEPEAEKLRILGFDADSEPLDVANQRAVAQAVKNIVRRHGKIDILVNSAGINVPHRYWRNQTPQGWEDVIRTNLDGTFYTMHAVLPGMRKRKDGLIINISSWAGVYHTKLVGPAYNASKRGVVAMTETVNMEEATNGIRACAICPGEVATPILDRRPVPPSAEDRARMLQPEDIGTAIRFVAELPPRTCINELIISPTWNRFYVGTVDNP